MCRVEQEGVREDWFKAASTLLWGDLREESRCMGAVLARSALQSQWGRHCCRRPVMQSWLLQLSLDRSL